MMKYNNTIAYMARLVLVVLGIPMLAILNISMLEDPLPINVDTWNNSVTKLVDAATRPYQRMIPLMELTRSDEKRECPQGQVFVPDTVLDPALAWEGTEKRRKIPKIVHVTAASRCMAPEFAENLEKWRLPGHSFFLHDNIAMETLMDLHWPEYPQLQNLLRCVKYGGAMLADIWRLLALWEYGGIYTDIDNQPNKFNENTLTDEDEGFFQFDVGLCPSQWFFAIAPRHPMMYHSIQSLLLNLMNMEDTGMPKIIWTTGPGAILEGFKRFARMGDPDVNGTFFGRHGHKVRLVGHQSNEQEWVYRSLWNDNEKHEIMQRSNMTHLTFFEKKESTLTCQELMYLEDKGNGWEGAFPQLW